MAQTPTKKTMRRSVLLKAGGGPVSISMRAEGRVDISLSRTGSPAEPREASYGGPKPEMLKPAACKCGEETSSRCRQREPPAQQRRQFGRRPVRRLCGRGRLRENRLDRGANKVIPLPHEDGPVWIERQEFRVVGPRNGESEVGLEICLQKIAGRTPVEPAIIGKENQPPMDTSPGNCSLELAVDKVVALIQSHAGPQRHGCCENEAKEKTPCEDRDVAAPSESRPRPGGIDSSEKKEALGSQKVDAQERLEVEPRTVAVQSVCLPGQKRQRKRDAHGGE